VREMRQKILHVVKGDIAVKLEIWRSAARREARAQEEARQALAISAVNEFQENQEKRDAAQAGQGTSVFSWCGQDRHAGPAEPAVSTSSRIAEFTSSADESHDGTPLGGPAPDVMSAQMPEKADRPDRMCCGFLPSSSHAPMRSDMEIARQNTRLELKAMNSQLHQEQQASQRG
jgi:hypothetical protein